MFRVAYHPDYVVTFPPDHPFPVGKFQFIYEYLLQRKYITEADIIPLQTASWNDLALVHDANYLGHLERNSLDAKAIRRIGLPVSPALIRRSRLEVQGTISAARYALQDGIASNTGGGTHHAYPDHGEGFCVLNDVPVAIRTLQQNRSVEKVLIIDLDVHQGNGTAEIFQSDSSVFTFSMHGKNNYPFRKSVSSRDIALADGMGADEYLDILTSEMTEILSACHPDIVFYLAGVDVLKGDRFGKLALSEDGLYRRDRYILEMARTKKLPIVLLASGGYAGSPQRTAELHLIAYQAARDIFL